MMLYDLLVESFFRYYATDWAAMIFTFFSVYALSHKNRSGFIYGSIACGCWLMFGILAGSIASPIANGIFIIANIRGYFKWRKEAALKKAAKK